MQRADLCSCNDSHLLRLCLHDLLLDQWPQQGMRFYHKPSTVYLCVFCVFFHTAYMLCYCQHSGVDLMGLKPGPWDFSSFSALTLLVGSFDS